MGSEVFLVEVSAKRYKKGEDAVWSYLQGSDLSFPYWEWGDIVSDIKVTANESLFEYNDIRFEQDCWAFRFTFVNENFDSYFTCGFDYELEGLDYDDLFEGFESQLIVYAEQLLNEHDKKNLSLVAPQKNNFVRFLTMWEYNCWEDSYYKEFDSDWDLLGLVRMDDIKSLIYKE